MSDHSRSFLHKLSLSVVLTLMMIVLLYLSAIGMTILAPQFVDPTWVEPTSYYQVQMYEVSDPNFFISSESTGARQLQYVHRLKTGSTLLAFEEDDTLRIVAPMELEKFITKQGEKTLKLTSKLLLLREPEGALKESAQKLRTELQAKDKTEKKPLIDYTFYELYDPQAEEVFSVAYSDGVFDDFVASDFKILDEKPMQNWHKDPGVIYVKNPREYRVSPFGLGEQKGWRYDPKGKSVSSVKELTGPELGFRSRKELIAYGEQIYAQEGCWYCHTDQTRTLVQDTILNGSAAYPAPPSSANEYIYQKVTFPGTRRIGPDLSRVGIKRPSRDWHKSHFWAPKTASAATIMPAFHHFFDDDPRGTGKALTGVPNYQFEAMFQYLMTKGTRITPPTEAWWLGRDPVNTLEIIEGRKVFK